MTRELRNALEAAIRFAAYWEIQEAKHLHGCLESLRDADTMADASPGRIADEEPKPTQRIRRLEQELENMKLSRNACREMVAEWTDWAVRLAPVDCDIAPTDEAYQSRAEIARLVELGREASADVRRWEKRNRELVDQLNAKPACPVCDSKAEPSRDALGGLRATPPWQSGFWEERNRGLCRHQWHKAAPPWKRPEACKLKDEHVPLTEADLDEAPIEPPEWVSEYRYATSIFWGSATAHAMCDAAGIVEVGSRLIPDWLPRLRARARQVFGDKQ